MLDDLRKIALRFQIDPENNIGHAAKVENVISVLANLNKSYKSFIKIELSKDDKYQKVFKNKKKIYEKFLRELELLIVDVKFDSFNSAIAPNIVSNQVPMFKDNTFIWKTTKFSEYKDFIVGGNYDDPEYINLISQKYTINERAEIFTPIFKSIDSNNNYCVNLLSFENKPIKKLLKPKQEKIKYYIENQKQEVQPEEKIINTFLKIKPNKDGTFDIKKSNVKEVLFVEELAHDTYPFQPDTIRFLDKLYILNAKLDCDVEFVENQYIIKNEKLDICVWGESRTEVEEAFSFAFCSLYNNFAQEIDNNLTEEAIILKNELKKIVKKVISY